MFGALLVAAAVVGPPPSVRADAGADVPCRDNDGFWCLYGKPNLEDGGGLIGTNNGDTDLKMDGDWWFFNDGTRSVSNRSGSFLGLYDDIDFKGLMACLPPHSSMSMIGPGVSSLRVHPTSGAACVRSGSAGRPKPKKSDPATAPTPEKTATPTEQPKKTEEPDPSPSLALPPVDAVKPKLPSAPPVNASATKSAGDESGGVAWGAVAAIGGVVATLLALGIGGWIVGRRRRPAVPVPRTATDAGAAGRVHTALLLLAIDCDQEKRDVPKVRAVTIDAAEVTLHLAAADGNAPQPWRVAPGGLRWHLSVTDIDELTEDVDPAAPYPLLAAVRPGMWVNLAALPGPIALTGNRKAARKAAVEMARRLREDPWHWSVRVRMVGFPLEATIEPEAGTERGRVVFINDGMEVPDKTPPGSAVVAVGRTNGAGTIWRVRFGGSIVPPTDLLAKGPSAPSGTGSGSDDSSAASAASAGSDVPAAGGE
ncbi:peptidase inhibitor family I36 protein [Actinomadura sp. 9N215]|uniref:peptidase inhibitor family I36 protein n=1 Tax=Actinomadura sp. 9N215 TaxID=3375150 RepID=UPI00379F9DAB